MTDNIDAAVTAVAPPELKSTDTSVKAKLEAKGPKPSKVEEPKPEPVQNADPPEGEKDDAPEAEAPREKQKQRLPRWMQERLERERQVTEARTREAMLREFQEKSPKAEPEKAEAADKTLKDFDFDQDAYLEYKLEKKLEERSRKEAEQAAEKEQAKASETFKARVDSFEERAGDGAWQDIIDSPLNTDPKLKPLTDLFMGDEHDLDIAHHLATNPDELKRISGLTKLKQVKEIAKLAERFDEPEPEKKAPPKKTTNAPPPAKTVSGASKSGAIDLYDPGMSTADRIKLMRTKS